MPVTFYFSDEQMNTRNRKILNAISDKQTESNKTLQDGCYGYDIWVSAK
jgi:hypothetical protein